MTQRYSWYVDSRPTMWVLCRCYCSHSDSLRCLSSQVPLSVSPQVLPNEASSESRRRFAQAHSLGWLWRTASAGKHCTLKVFCPGENKYMNVAQVMLRKLAKVRSTLNEFLLRDENAAGLCSSHIICSDSLCGRTSVYYFETDRHKACGPHYALGCHGELQCRDSVHFSLLK